MVLLKQMEDFIHLLASSIAKASGSESPEVYASVVLDHARALAEKIEDPYAPQEAHETEQPAPAESTVTPPDAPAPTPEAPPAPTAEVPSAAPQEQAAQ